MLHAICRSVLTRAALTFPSLHAPATRNVGFFTNLTADEIWKAVTTVSNAGRKRGRSRGLMRRRDFNKGQRLGVGRQPMQWPGLTGEPLRAGEVVRQEALPTDQEASSRLLDIRQSQSTGRAIRIPPLQRGWAGHSLPGQVLGNAEVPATADQAQIHLAAQISVICLDMKTVSHMTRCLGRVRSYCCVAAAGNGNGLVGLVLSRGKTALGAVRQALRRCSHKVVYVERCDGHTVLHDFFSRFLNAKVFVQRRPPGHGLQCPRVIAALCRLVGIRDIFVRIEGSRHCRLSVARAFVLGLLRQRSHQQLADQKRLHLVELVVPDSTLHTHRPLLGADTAVSTAPRLQRVLASPTGGARFDSQVPPDENTDFLLHVLEGKVAHLPDRPAPFYHRTRGYQKYLHRIRHTINHEQVRVRLLAEYGELRSFLAEDHPECRAASHSATREKDDDQEDDEYDSE